MLLKVSSTKPTANQQQQHWISMWNEFIWAWKGGENTLYCGKLLRRLFLYSTSCSNPVDHKKSFASVSDQSWTTCVINSDGRCNMGSQLDACCNTSVTIWNVIVLHAMCKIFAKGSAFLWAKNIWEPLHWHDTKFHLQLHTPRIVFYIQCRSLCISTFHGSWPPFIDNKHPWPSAWLTQKLTLS